MKKKTLRKHIRKSFTKSSGRFFSIVFLMAIGSFALVGLKVTGPNMRTTSINYFKNVHLADISIISDYGLDDNDQAVINQVVNADKIEYGYLKDVVIKDTKMSFRVFSKPEMVSNYELVEGKLPETKHEIAISNKYRDDYNIGDKITFTEKEDISGNTVLEHHEFEVVGYVLSSEILSTVNLGATTAGTGNLSGYAVVVPDVFDSNIYMMARLTFKDTKDVDPYSDEYSNLVQKHKDELAILLSEQPEQRLASVKTEYQEDINEGQELIGEAKQKIIDTEAELEDARNELDESLVEILDNEIKLNDAKREFSEGEEKLNDAKSKVSYGEATLNAGRSEVNSKEQELENQKMFWRKSKWNMMLE
ncbi:hypothetical protein LJC13_03200 [Peptostreptococcaceae bacterium OttesenSCG-928-C18]|nr:hypothetical protein [Peptostreptococcaceae bacterium OttesenSCG-928-C18]